MGAEPEAHRRCMKIVWSKRAQSDFLRTPEHYTAPGSDFAAAVTARAVSAARLLAERSGMGPKVETSVSRKWRVPHTPFILLYRVDGESLRVARVMYGAQNWRPR